MTEERLQEVYRSVVINAFYTVGRDKFLDSDITHEEMRDLVLRACEGKPFVQKEP